MEKSTKIMLVFVAMLGTLVVAMALEPSRNFVLTALQQGVANPIYLVGLAFNDWLALHPALWILGAGLLGGLVLAVVVNTVVRPRVHIGTPKLPKVTSTTSTSHTSLSQTPSDATTRPPDVTVEEVVAKVKEEIAKEETTANEPT